MVEVRHLTGVGQHTTKTKKKDYYNDLIGNCSNIFSISKLIFCL